MVKDRTQGLRKLGLPHLGVLDCLLLELGAVLLLRYLVQFFIFQDLMTASPAPKVLSCFRCLILASKALRSILGASGATAPPNRSAAHSTNRPR